MSEHDNKAVLLEYVKAFSRGDVDGVCSTFAPNAEIHGVHYLPLLSHYPSLLV
jgi:hypothetical protein